MRRLLLTTALVSLAAIPAARAELEVTTSGHVTFQAGLFDNDNANSSSRDFQVESEIHIGFRGTADNGLTYGAMIELQASTSDTVASDEAYLYLEGSFGRLELGDQDGAGSELVVMAPYIGIGQVRGSYVDFVPAADRGHRASETGNDTFLKALDTYDATKITYYTPVFNGFQAGVSFAPERDNQEDGEQVQFFNNVGDHKDAFEVGLAYKGTFNDVKVAVGGQYTGASSKSGSAIEGVSAWALGAQVGYNGFTFGGGYKHDGDSGQAVGTANDTVTGWNLGLTYASGAWSIGASYAVVDFDEAATPFEVAGTTGSGGDYTAYGVGAGYKVAPGLTVGADLMFFDRNRVTGADTDGYVLITEVKAAF